MGMLAPEIPYIINPNAPRVRAHGLQQLDFIGSDGLFTLFQFVPTDGGLWVKETAVFVEMPITAIGPSRALVDRKMGASLIDPVENALLKRFVTQ